MDYVMLFFGEFMNYQNELKKMTTKQLEFIADTIKLAGIGNWRSVFLSAKNRTISPRVKALCQAFADCDNPGDATDAYLDVFPQFHTIK